MLDYYYLTSLEKKKYTYSILKKKNIAKYVFRLFHRKLFVTTWKYKYMYHKCILNTISWTLEFFLSSTHLSRSLQNNIL